MLMEMLKRGNKEGQAFQLLKVSLFIEQIVCFVEKVERNCLSLWASLKTFCRFRLCLFSSWIISCRDPFTSKQWMAAGCSVRAGRVSRRSRQLEEQHVDKGWRCQVEQSLNFYKHGPGQTNCLCRVTDGATVTLDRQLKADLLILLKCTSSRWAFAASPAIRAECCQDAR